MTYLCGCGCAMDNPESVVGQLRAIIEKIANGNCEARWNLLTITAAVGFIKGPVVLDKLLSSGINGDEFNKLIAIYADDVRLMCEDILANNGILHSIIDQIHTATKSHSLALA